MPANDEIENTIGKRLRATRLERRMSRLALAAALGITYQQVEKYEAGRNRISASMLFKVAKLLDVEMSYFFVSDDSPQRATAEANLSAENELASALNRIDDDLVRRRFIELLAAVEGYDRRK